MTITDAINWIKGGSGKSYDYDGVYGAQCFDWFNFYYKFLTGRNPYSDGLAVPGAKDIWNVRNDDFDYIGNNVSDPNQVPSPGDILIYNGSWGGGYGHVEMVLSADSNGVNVSAQNSKGQYVSEEFRQWNDIASGLIGWMHYKHFVSEQPAAQLTGNQRIVVPEGARYRQEPNTSSQILDTFDPGAVCNFKGFVHGENVNGNDIWFVGAISAHYSHCSGYTDQGTHDLADMTPSPVPSAPTPPPVTSAPSAPETSVVQYPTPSTDPDITEVVNKKNPLPADYMPDDLRQIDGGQFMRAEAAYALMLMQEAAKLDGITLTSSSGYRSYKKQQDVYNAYVASDGQAKADTYSARPGHSEHQTGLAMDFAPIGDVSAIYPAYKWLKDSAHKFGFILRYPQGKDNITGYMDEPWHWRYVGVTAANDIHSKDITLETYTGISGGNYANETSPPGLPDNSNISKEENVVDSTAIQTVETPVPQNVQPDKATVTLPQARTKTEEELLADARKKLNSLYNLLERSLHTAWQTGAATLATLILANGIPTTKTAALAIIGAVAGAMLSAIKTVWQNRKG